MNDTSHLRTVAVLNPVAGRLSPKEKRGVLHHEWGADLTITETSRDDSVESWLPVIRDENPDVVVVGGGDGTVRHVVAALHAHGIRIPVGHVPFGTANFVARSLGFSANPEEAARQVHEGNARGFDLGQVDDGPIFILAASIGMPAELLDGAPRTSKDKLGLSAYLYGGRHSLEGVRHPAKVRVSNGSEELGMLESGAIFIVNLLRLEEFGMDIGKSVASNDGKLMVMAITTDNLLQFAWTAIEFVMGREKESERIWIRNSDRIELEFSPPLKIQVDGEVLGTRDLIGFRAMKDAATFIVSKSYMPSKDSL